MKQAALTTVSVFAISCLLGCSGEDDTGARFSAPSSPSMTTPSTTSSKSDLTIAGGAYDADLTVEPGATVTVYNTDSVAHNIVAEDGSFRIDNIPPDEMATFTAPSEPGAYPFECTLQPNMRATLTVRLPESPEETTPGQPAPDDSTTDAPATRTTAPGEPAPGGY